jgi:molybdopterin-binding protein
MNKLTGFIKEIKTCDEIIQLFIDVNDEIFSSLILSSNEVYKIDEKINILFKETEVMVGTITSEVSARNTFISPILSIKVGEILAQIEFDFDGIRIFSVITKGALYDLKCKVGDKFKWFVKSNEVSIQRIV